MNNFLESVADFYYKPHLTPKLMVLTVLVAIASNNRFLQDDAYISFCYAQNLVEHGRLSYNATGEFVEGYSNFLWTMLMALGLLLKAKLDWWSQLFSIISWTACLHVIYRWAKNYFQRSDFALLAMSLIGTHYTVSIYATGGLETALQLLLTVATVFQTLKLTQLLRKSIITVPLSSSLLLSLLWALGCLNRMDFGLVVLWSLLWLSVSFFQNGIGTLAYYIRFLTQLSFPGLLIVSAWLIWKFNYYGDIFPNTFYAKMGIISIRRVLFYTGGLLAYYFLIPSLLIVFFHHKQIGKVIKSLEAKVFLSFILLWIAYVIKVGADFMEFRMMVPLLPFCYLLMVMMWKEIKNLTILITSCCLLLLSSYLHGNYYEGYFDISSKATLSNFLMHDQHNLIDIGKKLGHVFQYDSSISAGIVSAGAINYHAKFQAIDLLGLNDRYIAKHGRFLTDIPGHQKVAPLHYLYHKKVNLVVGSAVDARKFTSESERYAHYVDRIEYGVYRMADSKDYPSTYRIFEIPLDEHYQLYMWYLHPHPKIDSLIQEHNWVDKVVEGEMVKK